MHKPSPSTTTPEVDLQEFLDASRRRVEAALDHWLPEAQLAPRRLHAAMRYAALGSGKRIRPVLVYGAGAALGVAPERLDGAACAVELIHAYSLVHDDLPAMDDDELRRGRETCHKAYDEATAILAGDALQALAFQVLCCDPALAVDAPTRLRMIETLARASGSRGMAGGQALDMAAVGKPLDLAQLENLHIHKTGALIRAAVGLGALAAPSPGAGDVKALDRYAKCVGLAFQVQDDILDVSGDAAAIGKTPGKDAAADKPTYPALLGLAEAAEKARTLVAEAVDSLADLGPGAEPLRALARYIIGRDH
jgi:geranylgeranyl diphosphate synthase, type II